jgi:hypothetical protein
VLKVPDATKPLFVAAAQYKPSRFSWGKPCLLVVTATAVVLLDVQNQGELEAKDGSHASIQLAVRASEVRSGGGLSCMRAYACAPARAQAREWAPLPPYTQLPPRVGPRAAAS